MKKFNAILSVLFCIGMFLFWWLLYPQWLSYQEQNQLFLWTWDYLAERLSVAGGLADWLGECLTQFFYIPWLGAALMALLMTGIQLLTARLCKFRSGAWYPLSFAPALLLLCHFGDMEVLPSYAAALLLALLFCPCAEKAGKEKLWKYFAAYPIAWWLIGPLAVLPAAFALAANRNWRSGVLLLWTLASAYLLYRLFLMQYTPRDAMFGINYYRLVESLPVLQVVIPCVVLLVTVGCRFLPEIKLAGMIAPIFVLAFAVDTYYGVKTCYDKDAYEVLAYDALIRNGEWQKVVDRAEKYQPQNPISASAVNLALFMTNQMDKRMPQFYQCGTEGLIMPSIRDNMSDIPSYEALWMMGMVNITLQYAFDCQESIQNGRKSGRFTSKIAECHIVNGHYVIAERYLDQLAHSTFYRKWALEKKALISKPELVDRDPVYAYLRSVRFKHDIISNYEALDLMMALLYSENNNNFMAAWYYQAWQLLKTTESNEEVSPDNIHGS